MKTQVNSVIGRMEGFPEGGRLGGKVTKRGKREEKDSAAINEYLHKLQELVPFTPKNKKLSKLEVISYVIDYIQDLRETLGLPPSPCQNGREDPLDEQFSWMLFDSSVCPGGDSTEVCCPAAGGPLPMPVTIPSHGSIPSLATPSPSARQPLGVLTSGNGNGLSHSDLASSPKVPVGVRILQTTCATQM